MKRALLALGAVALGLGCYLLLWPVPIDPAAWTPPASPAHPVNARLAEAAWRCKEHCVASEDVAVAHDGTIYLAMRDGRIARLPPGAAVAAPPDVIADTGGRPLGMHLDPQRNRLVICDTVKGLLALDLGTRKLETLAASHGGRPFRFTDDADVAADGTIYFSDASSKFGQHEYRLDVMEHRPHGRLLRWRPDTRSTELLVDGLYFANGVALAEDESFVLFNETTRYRVNKLWLTGPRAGAHEVLLDNLPGIPDGISRGSRGIFWVAFFTPRNAMLDGLLPSPLLRKIVLRLPQALQPQAAPHGLALGIDSEGRIVHDLQDASPDAFSPVTSVQESGGKLYFGSLTAPGFLELPVPAPN